MGASATDSNYRFPGGVPQAALHYLDHTEGGISLRALARRAGVHPSTVLRQVRGVETRRDDPLVDAALRRLGAMPDLETKSATDRSGPASEARMIEILARLGEAGAVLAVAEDMEKAVVVKETPDGGSARTAIVEAVMAEAMALRNWIACGTLGRVSRYRITTTGRQVLAQRSSALKDDASTQSAPVLAAETEQRRRFSSSESPLTLLARRRMPDGTSFLSPDHVRAGVWMREDFELSGLSPREALRVLDEDAKGTEQDLGRAGHAAARRRLVSSLRYLGPGLGDAALRCCCLLEGIETIEKHLGWSARSGKVVLRIALARLHSFYSTGEGRDAKIIG
ncbi:hypothetical protein SAMN05421853_10979 [Roseivivax halotolerans]|uniref:DUF6456 domain-containing protein n=1 Tax=Roseivivax halotolerans TaxID=93684 RepID=A0A1I5ZE11_9RHOB|nr:DUF6456 domain-containing protein [Roseivivax halotolerans]SFQ54729.1 hypothetical protein SAMN05421853_10979 [Roseivivax halotolerans]